MNQPQHRSEYFGARNLSIRRKPVHDRWPHKAAIRKSLNSSGAAIHQQARPLSCAQPHQPLNAGLALCGDHRAHLNAGIHAVAHYPIGCGIGNCLHKLAVHTTDRDCQRCCQAALAGIAKRGISHDAGRHLQVSIGQHHNWILCATLRLHAFTIGCGPRVHMPRHRRAAHKSYRVHKRMIQNRIDRHRPAIHQIDHSFGQLKLVQQIKHALHCHRAALGRLQNECVAACQRIWQIPKCNHAGKIERRDRGAYAHGLPDHVLVNAARNVLRVIALHQHWNAAGHLHVLHRPCQLAA